MAQIRQSRALFAGAGEILVNVQVNPEPPVFTLAPTTATVEAGGEIYFEAVDQNDLDIVWSLTSAPSGYSIAKSSGITALNPSGPAYATGAETRAAIIAEAMKASGDPSGEPLPLVGHWHAESMSLAYQLGETVTNDHSIAAGYPILPFVQYSSREFTSGDTGLETVASYGLPLTVITGRAWEYELVSEEPYVSLPEATTARRVTSSAPYVTDYTTSPLGATSTWATVGAAWGNCAVFNSLQGRYPNPPLVLWISNNELAREMRPYRVPTDEAPYYDLETDVRWVAAHGTGTTQEFKLTTGRGLWIDRYQAMFDGMRNAFAQNGWKSVTKLMGYNSCLARGFKAWQYWASVESYWPLSGTYAGASWQPYVWQGAMPDIYDNDWEWAASPTWSPTQLYSPQSQSMVRLLGKNIALSIDPGFWYELIFWDGELFPAQNGWPAGEKSTVPKALWYASKGITLSPEYYKGWTQYALWIVRPRATRDFRSASTVIPGTVHGEYYKKIIESVAHVHQDATLRRFWRLGTLETNPTQIPGHPNQQTTAAGDGSFDSSPWASVNTIPWAHLTTSVDPTIPAGRPVSLWGNNCSWPVYTLAYRIGTAPNREWLIYAHATGINAAGNGTGMATLTNVVVTIPNYQNVTLASVPVSGAFYHVVE